MIHSIPTEIEGVVYRSRLEARWAIALDLLDWDVVYEPVDLNGWIPDFVGQNCLIEIKLWEEMESAKRKISASSPNKTVYMLGERFKRDGEILGYIFRPEEHQWYQWEPDRIFCKRVHDAFTSAGNLVQYKAPQTVAKQFDFPRFGEVKYEDLISYARKLPTEFVTKGDFAPKKFRNAGDYIEAVLDLLAALSVAQLLVPPLVKPKGD